MFDDSTPVRMVLPSGLAVESPLHRLRAFFGKEYDYYDAIEDHQPNEVMPVDVLATVSMNSFIRTADQVRAVHHGMSPCNAILETIPVDADIRTFDPELRLFQKLIHAAVQARGVLIPVATKVLHRKRRSFVPMLDNVILKHYLQSSNRPTRLDNQAQSKATAGMVAMEVLQLFRVDLLETERELDALRRELLEEGFVVSLVRILEVLIWTESEIRGYYRDLMAANR